MIAYVILLLIFTTVKANNVGEN